MPDSALSNKSLPWPRVALLLAIALAGFAWVKWLPYYAKAFVAYSERNIGASILGGAEGVLPQPSWQAALDYAFSYGNSIWQAMVLGLVLGSGLKVLLPAPWISTALGRLGLRSTVLGTLLALPCMMCTCCAAPVAAGLRQRQASVGSVVAWWLANPVLNPATLVFMGFVLGWGWVVLRLLFGVVMVVGVAWLAERVAGARNGIAVQHVSLTAVEESSGVSAGVSTESSVEKSAVVKAEMSKEYGAGNQPHFLLRWAREFLQLALRIVPEYLVLVLLLGAARAWLFPVAAVDESLFWIAAMAFAGMLFVIPTAAEVPIVQTLLALGGGVGPAAALLITLPAVSLPSLAMLGTVLDLRTRLTIGAAVVVLGILAGLLAQQLATTLF